MFSLEFEKRIKYWEIKIDGQVHRVNDFISLFVDESEEIRTDPHQLFWTLS